MFGAKMLQVLLNICHSCSCCCCSISANDSRKELHKHISPYVLYIPPPPPATPHHFLIDPLYFHICIFSTHRPQKDSPSMFSNLQCCEALLSASSSSSSSSSASLWVFRNGFYDHLNVHQTNRDNIIGAPKERGDCRS